MLDELKIKPVIVFIQIYHRKWKEHVKRMNTGRIPKQILQFEWRRRLSWMSGEEVGGKYNTVTNHLA